MNKSALLYVLLSIVPIAVTGCQSAPDQEVEKISLSQPASTVQDNPNLESRVSTLEQQMKMAQPTLKKVEAIETHFKALSFELDKITDAYKINESAVKTVPPKSEKKSIPAVEPKKGITKPVEKEEVKNNTSDAGEFSVTSVRIGEQGKEITRIVLDTTKTAEINYDLDNVEGLLVIEIPKAGWSTTKSQTFQKSPMVKSFQALSDEKGSRFVADLKQKAKVVATARLAPSGTSGHRVYIDIQPAK